MSNIFIFSNFTKPQTAKVTSQVIQFLNEHQMYVFVEDKYADTKTKKLSTIPPEDIDYCISIGGDGTILEFLHTFSKIKAPLLGINLGKLGFLADVRLDELIPSLKAFVNQEFNIEERLMLEYNNLFALNDIVIHRASNPALIELNIHVDGNYFNTFRADGIIIATPTGSTAYSLSAGGPIITPSIKALCLTTICPHAISNRPIVFLPEKELVVEYISPYKPVEVTIDGITQFHLKTKESLTIHIAKRTFKLLNLQKIDTFATLRNKLNWSGKF
ncbi:MAG: NAD kinase [Chlamydiae bacterium]|nr:NAD kinase [Chlamydiota bacterium]